MVEIYAEIPKKIAEQMDEEQIRLPSNVSMKRKLGSRASFISVDGDEIPDNLTYFLDSHGINWQEM